jgi:hypothetical protein
MTHSIKEDEIHDDQDLFSPYLPFLQLYTNPQVSSSLLLPSVPPPPLLSLPPSLPPYVNLMLTESQELCGGIVQAQPAQNLEFKP